MTPAEITALRAQACELIAVLGETLDALQTVEQILGAPSGSAIHDETAIALQLNEAAASAELLAGGADDFAKTIDRHYITFCPSAAQEDSP